jgi:hypothetical protein
MNRALPYLAHVLSFHEQLYVAQGYYLSRPVAGPDLVQWHTTWTT